MVRKQSSVSNRVVKVGFIEKVPFEERLEGEGRVSHIHLGVRMCKAEGTGDAKALRQLCAQHVSGTARQPVWLTWCAGGEEFRDIKTL